MNANPLGVYLKRKRIEAGLTQMSVAKSLGYTTSQYISNFERSECQVSLHVLEPLVKLYKLDTAELFDIVMEQQRIIVSDILFARRRSKSNGKRA